MLYTKGGCSDDPSKFQPIAMMGEMFPLRTITPWSKKNNDSQVRKYWISWWERTKHGEKINANYNAPENFAQINEMMNGESVRFPGNPWKYPQYFRQLKEWFNQDTREVHIGPSRTLQICSIPKISNLLSLRSFFNIYQEREYSGFEDLLRHDMHKRWFHLH